MSLVCMYSYSYCAHTQLLFPPILKPTLGRHGMAWAWHSRSEKRADFACGKVVPSDRVIKMQKAESAQAERREL